MASDMQETIEIANRIVFRLLTIAQIGCFVVILLSFIVLIGWGTQISLLKSILPGFLPMNPIESLCFICISCALFIRIKTPQLSPPKLFFINLVSLIPICVGSSVLISLFTHIHLPLDTILFSAQLGQSHISPNSAGNLVLFGIGLFVFTKNPKQTFALTQICVLIAGIVTMFAGIGYVYNAISFYTFATYSPMPLNTTAAFTLLCICSLLSTHSYGMMRILTADMQVSSFARKLIAAVIFLPIILGGFATIIHQLFDIHSSTAFLVLSQIILFTIIIWITTQVLFKNELKINTMTHDLTEKNSELKKISVELSIKNEDLQKANKKIEQLLNHEENLKDILSNTS